MASWVELVASLCRRSDYANPEPAENLAALERSLAITLPARLREFLFEHGPLRDRHEGTVVWSAAEIEARNREFRVAEALRELYMPFDHLLLFGERGNGDLFAFPVQGDGVVHNNDVFLWEHETDARSWFAGDFRAFLVEALRDVA
jgi:SMI1-KNR4 cell-wall